MRRLLPLLLTASTTFASLAWGDTSADAKAKADVLFKEGRALAKGEKWAEACPKFEESQKLDWAAGTLLNLGVCHARIGKSAKAYGELAESLTIAIKQKKGAREKIARDELAAIEPKIARITVNVAAPPPSLIVTIDGELLPAPMYGIARVVDPGEHAIEAGAPGKKNWETKISVAAKDRASVDVPELEVGDAPAPIVATTGTSAITPASASSTSTSTITMVDSSSESGSSKKTIGLIVGGVGVVSLGAGVVFALRASSLDSQKSDLAKQGDAAGANDKADQAKSAVTLARIGVGVGIAAVGVGAWMFLTSRGEEPAKTVGMSVTPAIGPGYGGVSWGGAW